MAAGLKELTAGIIAARTTLAGYSEFVHGWRPRPHQVEWYQALQALYEGKVTYPSQSEGGAADEEGRASFPEEGLVELPTTKLMILASPGWGKTDTLCEYTEWVIGKESEAGRTAQIG